MLNDDTALERIEAGLLATTAFARDVTHSGGFQVAVAPGAAPGLAVAVPERAGIGDLDAALAEVEAAFHRHGLEPAIECIEERHPALEAAAHARGWRTAMRVPVMVLDGLVPAVGRADDGRTVLFPDAAELATLETYLRGQHRAYGGDGVDGALAWLSVLRAGLAAGTILVAAATTAGRIVAGASVQIGAGVGELAGVWTLPEERRRGHAAAVCTALLQRLTAAGATACWLSAAPEATALYERLGFRRIGSQINLAGPLPEPRAAGADGAATALS